MSLLTRKLPTTKWLYLLCGCIFLLLSTNILYFMSNFINATLALVLNLIYIVLIIPMIMLIKVQIRKTERATEQLSTLYQSIDGVLWVKDIKSGQILNLSSKVEEISGYSHEELKDSPEDWYDLIIPEDRPYPTKQEWLEKLKDGREKVFQYRIYTKYQEVRWVKDHVYPIYAENGELVQIGGMLSDITAEKGADSQLNFLLLHDSVTQLPNYQAFDRQLMKLTTSKSEPFVLLVLKLSRLNMIREQVSHQLADQILDELMSRFRPLMNNQLFVARLSDSRFAVIDYQVRPKSEIVRLMNLITEKLEHPINIDQYEFFLNVHMGITHYPKDGQGREELENKTHAAMDYARENQISYAFYQEKMMTKTRETMKLEADLRKALEKDELLLYYQPKVHVESGNVQGVEALLRWRRTNGDIISPAVFIPLAEKTGTILPIGEWVIKEACFQLKEWNDQGMMIPHVSVNLSKIQLFQHNFVGVIERIIEESEIEPHQLELEVTESMAIGEVRARKILLQIKELGVRVSIDDFGTGYSSLNQLRHLPIDVIKIDRSFVNELVQDKKAEAMIKTLILMSKHLNLDVVVEGVETFEQLQLLVGDQTPIIQGYLFSEPVPANELLNTKISIKSKAMRDHLNV
ncbi:putative bifunctional diguanylate cyclase/phosphodiesterase [Bacillus sp. FJAT-45037]|uniref:putative bifunctional diguanylate cyclase/phosphodiesterase n=1 Tax=Bacillus sp. FJAT-45037 TaxID=2011007 RepID=UPI000C238238|nr:EAL domain-containing protein [Bacillus sp. FJAT-45037]